MQYTILMHKERKQYDGLWWNATTTTTGCTYVCMYACNANTMTTYSELCCGKLIRISPCHSSDVLLLLFLIRKETFEYHSTATRCSTNLIQHTTCLQYLHDKLKSTLSSIRGTSNCILNVQDELVKQRQLCINFLYTIVISNNQTFLTNW